MEVQLTFLITAPAQLPEGAAGPKRFVIRSAQQFGLGGNLQKCAEQNRPLLVYLQGTVASFESFRRVLR